LSPANGHARNGHHDDIPADRPRLVAFPEDRLPPQNLEAERSVLGGLLLDFAAMHEVAGFLRPEDFWRDHHAAIFARLLALHGDGRSKVDLIVLVEELERSGDLEAVGGVVAVGELCEVVTVAADTVYHARIVAEKAALRRLIEQANATLRAAYANRRPAGELAGAAVAAFDAVARTGEVGRPKALAEAVAEARALIEARRSNVRQGVVTPLHPLNTILGGCLGNGRLVVIAGRPGSGKTALGLNIAAHAAIDQGVPVLFASLEMDAAELGERLLAERSGVWGWKLKEAGMLTAADLAALDRAGESIRLADLEIDDRPGRSLLEIVGQARRRGRSGVGLVVVDYLQLIRDTGGDDRGKARHEVVGEISARLKQLARELNVPVVALCQLNRQSEQTADRRPMLSHLRESGSVEQDADQVILVHRPELYDKNDRPGEADLIVAKNRQGTTGIVRTRFNGPLSRFEPLDDPRMIPPGGAEYPGHNGEPF
jgi:replicative DNA helicase